MIVFLFGCPGSFLWEISEETIKMKFLFSVQLTETTHENQVESWNLCNKKRLKKKKKIKPVYKKTTRRQVWLNQSWLTSVVTLLTGFTHFISDVLIDWIRPALGAILSVVQKTLWMKEGKQRGANTNECFHSQFSVLRRFTVVLIKDWPC